VHFVSAVEVLASAPLGTAAVVGDSITDGMFGLHGLDAETMWADVENFQLLGAGSSQLSVVNQAIAGNKLLPATDPMSVLGRLDHDALALTGVRTVVVEIGANDLVAGSTSTQILAGLQQVIDRAHAAGLRVVGATIPPYAWRDASASAPCYDNAITPAEQGYENQRQATNLRIRPGQPNSLNFDAVVDFDAALRWTTDPRRVAATYLGWDCIHLNPTGHQSLATAVPPPALLP
jgi:lysophospholipase L1-like esterase